MSWSFDPPPVERPGLLSRLLATVTGRRARAEEEGPPLFRARPVPPPEPRGPGLPEMEDILLEAPRPPDPARQPRPTLVATQPPPLAAPAPAAPAPVAAAPEPEPESAAQPTLAALPAPARPLSLEERRALARIRLFAGAAMLTEAQALLDQHFARQPHLKDEAGLPVYLIESYRLAAARHDVGTMQALAERLRPALAATDPLLETLAARAAARARPAAARDFWHAALARAPGLPEAEAWLAAHPAAPEAGRPAAELIPPAPAPGLAPALPAAPPPAPPLTSLGIPAGMPARLAAQVTLRLEGGLPLLAEGEAAWAAARDIPGAAPGTLALVLRGEPPPVRALGFTELALALFALCRASTPAVLPARLHVGRQPWAMRPLADSPAALLAALFPGLRVIGGYDGAVREPAVMALEPALRHAASETLLGGMLAQAAQAAPAMRAAVFAAYGVADRPLRARPRALLLRPMPARALGEPARAALLSRLERAGYETVEQDLAALPWPEQLRAIHGAELVLGVHGPHLAAAAAWAHPQARVLELFPAGVRRYDTQLMAEAAGIAYLGIEAVAGHGFIVRPRDRSGPPRGEPGGAVDELPIKLLERALQFQRQPA